MRMASVRNKTAEIAEGRGGSVKKTLALLSRPLRLNPVVLIVEWGRFNQDDAQVFYFSKLYWILYRFQAHFLLK